MKGQLPWLAPWALGMSALTLAASALAPIRTPGAGGPFQPVIPRVWDSLALADFSLPLAHAAATPREISPAYYYQLPERVIYRNYAVYAPGREPAGYWEWLQQQEPQVVFDPAKLKTEADWIKAGELLFDAPIDLNEAILSTKGVRDTAFYRATRMPLTKDGIMPFARYVIEKKGSVVVGNLSCGQCHTRLEANGLLLKGAQGNFPGDKATAFEIRQPNFPAPVAGFLTRLLFAAPWVPDDPHTLLSQKPREEIAAAFDALPPGVLGRQGTGILFPSQVPDLIGVKDRQFLDHGGLNRHRDIGDMMRYIVLNQAVDFLGTYNGYVPAARDGKTLPAPGKARVTGGFDRYSEAQLYALARYVYSLTPPPNPNKPSALSKKGQVLFAREGCVSCHTPPLFTNNALTPADGFTIPEEHYAKYNLFDISIGTNPAYTLGTRRGTGYYKVPSLKGLWYRGPFLHDGSLATLADVLDPRRLRPDYVATGFRGVDTQPRPVKGHEFGMELNEPDRQALLAYLNTL